MYQYQQTNRYFAQIAGGLESDGAEELLAVGASSVDLAYRGVYFVADARSMYRCNYESRLVTRILAPLLTFDCHSDKYLYKTAREIDWSDFLGVDDSFAVVANVSNSRIQHSKYAALRLKDAIVDQFRDKYDRRPNIDRRTPDVWLNLHVDNNRAVISLDTSAGSLHRRGYRKESVDAPMQETVAAAIIRWTGWAGETPLFDPMCGSGTLVAEALMHVTRTPAGYLRPRFGFDRLPDFDPATWTAVKKEADGAIRSLPPGIIGASDYDKRAVAATQQNLSALPSGTTIPVTHTDYRDHPGFDNTTLVLNPPYGLRMGKEEDLSEFYRELGDFLKQRCTSCTAYIYFGNREWIKRLGLRASFKKPLVSGALDGRLVKYELY